MSLAALHRVLSPAEPGDVASYLVDIALVALILANVVAMVLETVPSIRGHHGELLTTFERVSMVLFMAEYALRAVSVGADPAFRGARGRLRYMVTPMAVIDLLAILPFLLAPLLPTSVVDLRHLRGARLLVFLRFAKLGRYSKVVRTFGRVFSAERPALTMVAACYAVLLFLAASLVYFAEHHAQPDVFTSIPHSMWWAVVTLTTVGYGDAVPVTFLGRLVGAAVAILGIGAVAIPAGILSAAFEREWERQHGDANGMCPVCGRSDEPTVPCAEQVV